ncbi:MULTISPECIES: LysM peptidoglycan-binding domain-containing protein [unclassified Dysgonomonas]|uniref:LysM peptidoglycan-binding domain-containing protein n=1 Tax=unclassified Dysgonomonas TaxID=2630389 RepID=UPI000681A3F1|nr:MULTISPECIES: hypothetical protein [unclassified Dysgonomonas]MBD8347939.1 hypothetical protein [Dysgonomonas sp. HGC4]MBF0575614.1 hypothetical protein [Dysgonomonas sp. GY617]
MNKQTDQLELNRIIAQQTLLDESVVEAFISQLFIEIEKSIIVDSHIKVDGLGIFRIIKSGDSHRILYLGSNTPIDNSIDLSHISREAENRYSDTRGTDTELEPTSSLEENIMTEEKEVESKVSIPQDPQDEADAIVIRNFLDSERNTNRNRVVTPTNHRKSNLVKTCIITLIILAVLGIGYIILSGSSIKPKEKVMNNITFKEMDNTDTINYSRIIIPESDVSLQYIARTYYGNDIYWPYIFEANKNIVNNQFIIQAGSITKIPKIAVDLVDLHNGNEASTVQALGDEIYKSIR